jgi:hypothetical protein
VPPGGDAARRPGRRRLAGLRRGQDRGHLHRAGISGAVHTKSDRGRHRPDGEGDGRGRSAGSSSRTSSTSTRSTATATTCRATPPTWSSSTRACRDVLGRMREDDVFILTADHGCDPADVSTDHTRENVPLLVAGRGCAGSGAGRPRQLRRPRRHPRRELRAATARRRHLVPQRPKPLTLLGKSVESKV